MDKSTKSRYIIILGRDLLKELGLDLKCSDHIISGDDVPFERCTSPMVDLGTYVFQN